MDSLEVLCSGGGGRRSECLDCNRVEGETSSGGQYCPDGGSVITVPGYTTRDTEGVSIATLGDSVIVVVREAAARDTEGFSMLRVLWDTWLLHNARDIEGFSMLLWETRK